MLGGILNVDTSSIVTVSPKVVIAIIQTEAAELARDASRIVRELIRFKLASRIYCKVMEYIEGV